MVNSECLEAETYQTVNTARSTSLHHRLSAVGGKNKCHIVKQCRKRDVTVSSLPRSLSGTGFFWFFFFHKKKNKDLSFTHHLLPSI